MATPSSNSQPPQIGDVIEFSYLWTHERAKGLSEGVKSRRCVIVAVLDDGGRVMVVPITGSDPGDIPKIALAGGMVGLSRPSWIVPSELNLTEWPGHDLRHALNPSGAWWRHGRLSNALRQKLADALASLVKSGSVAITSR